MFLVIYFVLTNYSALEIILPIAETSVLSCSDSDKK